MAIAIVWASPNKDGMTAACKDKAIEGIVEAGKEYKDIQLNAHDIRRCDVCSSGKGICGQGECKIEDDFAGLYKELRDSEAIIWITPVYWQEMAEPMRAFLSRVRRSDPLVNHHLQDKRCIIIASAGKSGNGALRTLFDLEYIMTQMKCVIVDRIPITRSNCAYMTPAVKAATKQLCLDLE